MYRIPTFVKQQHGAPRAKRWRKTADDRFVICRAQIEDTSAWSYTVHDKHTGAKIAFNSMTMINGWIHYAVTRQQTAPLYSAAKTAAPQYALVPVRKARL